MNLYISGSNRRENFESLGEFMNFETVFLKYISSGDVENINNVKKSNNNYIEIIEKIKGQIK